MAIFQMILFFMAGLMHSILTKATRERARIRHPKSTNTAKNLHGARVETALAP
ncbi:hypothetical protein [Pseudomonas sp. PH1b]|uniref:hypothetical protein n=1 Tax=Pseudomonas sp. PH1b TaxID=1397282 RepID=UPI0012FEDD00|nr:hypothetical protein [Pseudomonas sp. PH1b]